MPKMFTFLTFLLLATAHSQTETCSYMVQLQEVNITSCFTKMNNDLCRISQQGKFCSIEKVHGVTCVKRIAGAHLTCMDEELSKVPLENSICAVDQESLACTKEFPLGGIKTNSASHVTAGPRGFLYLFAAATLVFLMV